MVEFIDMHFSYSRKKPLFEGINLHLKAGNVYGLLGKNGVGKTTMLKLMSGLLFADAGQCQLMSFNPRNRKVGFLSSFFYVPDEISLPSMKLMDFIRVNKPFYPRFDEQQLLQYLEEFEISGDENLSKLSLGQKKKIYISFALACQTPVLLMDEPTNGLDIPSKSTFRKLLAAAAGTDRCIVISTHQVRDLDNLIDAVVIMDNSRILLQGTLDEITRKLAFKSLGKDEPSFYSESGIGGRWGVVENTSGEISKADIELLFNAVVTNKKEIGKIFE